MRGLTSRRSQCFDEAGGGGRDRPGGASLRGSTTRQSQPFYEAGGSRSRPWKPCGGGKPGPSSRATVHPRRSRERDPVAPVGRERWLAQRRVPSGAHASMRPAGRRVGYGRRAPVAKRSATRPRYARRASVRTFPPGPCTLPSRPFRSPRALVRVEPALEQGAQDRRIDLRPVEGRGGEGGVDLGAFQGERVLVVEQVSVELGHGLEPDQASGAHGRGTACPRARGRCPGSAGSCAASG